jgi:integrase
MRGNSHVRFGERAEETDRLKGWHCASARLDHTCAAFLIGQGSQQYQIMEHLGHRSVQTTIDTYGHLFPSVHADIRAALERTWSGGTSSRRPGR